MNSGDDCQHALFMDPVVNHNHTYIIGSNTFVRNGDNLWWEELNIVTTGLIVGSASVLIDNYFFHQFVKACVDEFFCRSNHLFLIKIHFTPSFIICDDFQFAQACLKEDDLVLVKLKPLKSP